MKNWFSKFFANTTPQEHNVLRVVVVVIFASLSSLPIYLYAAAQTGAWQLYAIIAGLFVISSMAIFSASLVRRKRVHLAIGLILGSVYFIIPFLVALVAGLGLTLSVTLLLVCIIISGQTLSGKAATRAVLASVAVAVITLLMDLFAPWDRLSVPQLQVVIPYISGAVVVILGFFLLRQYSDFSLRTKLLSAFLLVTLIPLVGVFIFNNITTGQNLTASSDAALQGVAAETAASLDTFIGERLNDVRTEALRHILAEYLTLPVSERAGSESESALYADLLAMSRRDQTFITSVGLLDKNGLSVADTEPTEVGVDKSGRNYFIGVRDSQLPYVSPVEISGTTGAISIYFSAPVRDSDGNFIGVLRIRYDATVIQSIVRKSAEQANLASLSLVVFDENHIRLAHNLVPELIFKSVVPLPADRVAQLQAEGRLPADKPADQLATNIQTMEDGLNNFEQDPFFVAEFHDEGEGNEEGTAVRLSNQPWIIAAGQDQDIFLAPLTKQTRTNTFIAFGVAGFVALIAIVVAQTISNPVVRLTNVAGQISAGDINVQAKVESNDEIGQLARAFNQMTAQLRDFITSLEQRVQERTKALSSVAEVGTAASTILKTDELLQLVVDLTKERFNFYHAHIYLLNETGDTLVLAAGAGEPGRQMVSEKRSIPLNREQSLVARAARDRKGVTVNDVTETPDFLPNPLLPETRSELAVPMIAGERVIGVFDVQSELVGRFTDADIAVQTTLSSQIAIAVQNAYQYEETRAALSQSERLFNASDRLSRASDMQDLIKAAVESLGIANIDRAVLGSLAYDRDELDSMTIVANWSQSAELPATPVGTHYSKEVLSSLSLFTSSEPLFFNDMLNDERVDETTKAIARKINYRSVAALPLFIGSRRDALILLEGREPHSFTQEEIRLFTSLGPQLATILENRRQFERTQEQARREATLNAITQKIQSATTIESALQMTARELGRALGQKPTLVSLNQSNGASNQEDGN